MKRSHSKVMRRKETENGEFSLAPLNGRQSVRIYRKDAKVEEHERDVSHNFLNE